jgi:hypothetical protein
VSKHEDCVQHRKRYLFADEREGAEKVADAGRQPAIVWGSLHAPNA